MRSWRIVIWVRLSIYRTQPVPSNAMRWDVCSQANFGQKEAVATSTTAYMLIYMRQSCVEHLVYELPEALQPHHLKVRLPMAATQGMSLDSRSPTGWQG